MEKLFNTKTESTLPFVDNKGREIQHLESGIRYTMIRYEKYILVLKENQIIEAKPKF